MTPAFEPVALSDLLLRLFPREYVSASSLKTFVRCPEQWRRRYVLGHKAPPNSNMLWGGADHRAVGHNYEQKILTEKDLPVPEVQEKFVAELESGIDESGGASEVEWSGRDFEDKTPAQAVALTKDRGAKLVAMYQEQVAPGLFPVSVEEEFLLPVNGLPPVKGYLDLTARRRISLAEPELLSPFVVERKTKGANKPPAPDDRFQAHLYELATGLPVEFQVSVKTQAPRVVVHEPEPLEPRERTVAAVERTVLQIASCFALWGEEQPWPDYGRLHPFSCSYCGFKESCPYWHEAYWPK